MVSRLHDSGGQSTVELVGMAPLLLFFGLIAFQLLLAGYAAVMVNNAAEAAALATVNGQSAKDAAGDAVPAWPKDAVKLKQKGERVTVELRPPSPFKFLRNKLSVDATAVAKNLGSP